MATEEVVDSDVEEVVVLASAEEEAAVRSETPTTETKIRKVTTKAVLLVKKAMEGQEDVEDSDAADEEDSEEEVADVETPSLKMLKTFDAEDELNKRHTSQHSSNLCSDRICLLSCPRRT